MAKTFDISVTSATINTIGNNTIHTPAVGNSVLLAYISLSADGANTEDVTVTVKYGSGPSKYTFSLKPGSIITRHIGANGRHLQGPTGQSLTVNLTSNQTVHVSIEFDELTI